MRGRPVAAAVAIALGNWLGTAPAGAQVGSGADPIIAARTLGYEGIEAFQAGDFVLADQKLSRAYRLLQVPALGLWSARALVKLNRLVEATRRYEEVRQSNLATGDPAVQEEAKRDAAREQAALLPRIPRVTLRLEGADWSEVTLTIDGVLLSEATRQQPISLNPGPHSLEAVKGALRRSERVELAESEHESVSFDFTRSAEATPGTAAAAPALSAGITDSAASAPPAADVASPWRTGGWVAVGVGGSAFVLSGVAGLIAWSQLDDFDCDPRPCRSDDRDAVNSYNSLVTASTVGYIAGGLVAGAGALLLLRYGSTEQDLTLGVGPLSATLQGRF